MMDQCGERIRVVHPLFQVEGGGSIPTSPLQLTVGRIDKKLFKALKPVILRGGSFRGEDPGAVAEKLGMSEPALRKALQRALAEYRKTLENEVLQTVADENEVDEELAYLRGLFGGK